MSTSSINISETTGSDFKMEAFAADKGGYVSEPHAGYNHWVADYVSPILFEIPILKVPVYTYGFFLAMAFFACYVYTEVEYSRVKMKADP